MDTDRLVQELQDALTVEGEVEGDFMVMPECTHACHHDGEDGSMEASSQSEPPASESVHSVQGTTTTVNHLPGNVIVATPRSCSTKRRKRKASRDREDSKCEEHVSGTPGTKRARNFKDSHWPRVDASTLEMCQGCNMSEEQMANFFRDQKALAAMGHQKKALMQYLHLSRFWQNLEVLEDGADRWAQFRITNYHAFWNGLVELFGASHEELVEGTQAWSSLQTAFTRLGYEPAGKSFKPKWKIGFRGEVSFVTFTPKPKRPRTTS